VAHPHVLETPTGAVRAHAGDRARDALEVPTRLMVAPPGAPTARSAATSPRRRSRACARRPRRWRRRWRGRARHQAVAHARAVRGRAQGRPSGPAQRHRVGVEARARVRRRGGPDLVAAQAAGRRRAPAGQRGERARGSAISLRAPRGRRPDALEPRLAGLEPPAAPGRRRPALAARLAAAPRPPRRSAASAAARASLGAAPRSAWPAPRSASSARARCSARRRTWATSSSRLPSSSLTTSPLQPHAQHLLDALGERDACLVRPDPGSRPRAARPRRAAPPLERARAGVAPRLAEQHQAHARGRQRRSNASGGLGGCRRRSPRCPAGPGRAPCPEGRARRPGCARPSHPPRSPRMMNEMIRP
jgi:hypothetical protein